MIRGIIFDCFGVLYGGSLNALTDMAPRERVQELRDINKQSDYGFISGSEYVDGLAEIIGTTREDIERILNEKHVRNQALIDFSQTLKPKYAVGLLSNVSSGTLDRLFPSGQLDELFDTVVLSYKEHLAKPNPAIFTLMADRMGLTPGECVMIDDLEANCDGAEIAGMQSIQHITNERTYEELSKILQVCTS